MNQAEQNYLKSIELLGAQIQQSYNEASKIKLPTSYGQVNKIVTCGMGGSQLGVDLINNLFSRELKAPIIQVRGYQLPGFVDANTLVFLLSYSGDTEEVLAVSLKLLPRRQAGKAKNLKVVVITVGGELAKIAKKNHWPMYQFEPRNNLSGQPRMGTGYSLGAMLAILRKLNLIQVSSKDIALMAASAKISKEHPSTRLGAGRARSKKLALALKNKIPIIVTAEHLNGNAHIMANQINESSKQRCYFFAIPELNHHLLEGLTYPKEGLKSLYFLLFFSKNYHPRNQKRFQITREVLGKQKIRYQQVSLAGSKISQALSMLALGSLLSYELAKLNKVDPNKIPWVNYFKKRLGK